jgi:quercetin dioxygenase-like cupin family protein
MQASDSSPPTVSFARDEQLPWVDAGDGLELKVLRVVASAGIWVVRNRFAPGVQIPTHKHTGEIHAYTQRGCWHYTEYGIDYPAGTYVYEPAGSVHTLKVNESNDGPTEAIFIMQGVNLNLGPNGEVERVDDGPTALAFYEAMCAEMGLTDPPVLRE